MKQRICIGQAILHKPDLIFFDEPTNGLDPKGAYELRQLIKSLATDGTTIFLNSHQLHEVEDVCERVAILTAGKLRTVARVEDLRRQFTGGEASIQVLNPGPALAAAIESVTGAAPAVDGTTFHFTGNDVTVAKAVRAVAKAGGGIVGVQRKQASLEDVFMRITEDA